MAKSKEGTGGQEQPEKRKPGKSGNRRKGEIELQALYRRKAQEKVIQKPQTDRRAKQAEERDERAEAREKKRESYLAKRARDRRAQIRAAKREEMFKEVRRTLALLEKAEAVKQEAKKEVEDTQAGEVGKDDDKSQLGNKEVLTDIQASDISQDKDVDTTEQFKSRYEHKTVKADIRQWIEDWGDEWGDEFPQPVRDLIQKNPDHFSFTEIWVKKDASNVPYKIYANSKVGIFIVMETFKDDDGKIKVSGTKPLPNSEITWHALRLANEYQQAREGQKGTAQSHFAFTEMIHVNVNNPETVATLLSPSTNSLVERNSTQTFVEETNDEQVEETNYEKILRTPNCKGTRYMLDQHKQVFKNKKIGSIEVQRGDADDKLEYIWLRIRDKE